MDKDKKQELAEFDQRWSFEKTVEVPNTEKEVDWEVVKDSYNSLQDDHGDLYMVISNLPNPNRMQKARLWLKELRTSGQKVTFHHAQIYRFYQKLAVELDTSIGNAVRKIVSEKEDLRETFDLGQTVSVSMNDLQAMDTSEKSSVTKEELQELIDDDG